MAGQVEGRVIMITGASRGIGNAMARALAAEGADLIIVSRSQQMLDELAKELRTLGGDVLPVAADVSCHDQVEAMVAKALDHYGRIDVLINNAGMQGPAGRVWEVDLQGWLRTIEVNLSGTFLCCRSVLPAMVARRQGAIINVSSGAGNSPMPNYSGYAASKAAVTHFTRTLAEESKPLGINANAIGVWGVTRLWDQVAGDGEAGGSSARGVAHLMASGTRPRPEENVALVVFLASDAARHITGQYMEANSLPEYVRRNAAK